MTEVTLKKILHMLTELKRKVDRLEMLVIMPEEELPLNELRRLKKISKGMVLGKRILWNNDNGYSGRT